MESMVNNVSSCWGWALKKGKEVEKEWITILRYDIMMYFEDWKVLIMISLTGLSKAGNMQQSSLSIQITDWLRQGEEVTFNKKKTQVNYSKDPQ